MLTNFLSKSFGPMVDEPNKTRYKLVYACLLTPVLTKWYKYKMQNKHLVHRHRYESLVYCDRVVRGASL